MERLDHRLDDLAEAEDFLAQDPDALIARPCQEFGVEPPAPLPLIPAKAGTQAEPAGPQALPALHRANGQAPPAPNSS